MPKGDEIPVQQELRLRRELIRANYLWRSGAQQTVSLPTRLLDLVREDIKRHGDETTTMKDHLCAIIELHFIRADMDDYSLRRLRAIEGRLARAERRVAELEARCNKHGIEV